MGFDKLPELFPEEKNMPLAKYYYDYPMKELSDEVKAYFAGPVDSNDAVDVHNFIQWLKPCGEYEKIENGYCMFDDGSGYICTYLKFPETVKPHMIFWYLKWLNIYSKSMLREHGNLRYKIWNPADHWDHYFINWNDPSDGIHTTESLDLGEGDRKYDTIRHWFDLKPFGLTEEIKQKIEKSGCSVGDQSAWESFDEPGAHLTMGQIRPCPDGGFERRSVEWIGWRPTKDGRLVREERTHCDEAYLYKVAIHTLTEWYHLIDFIVDLYNEYHDKPADAD